MAKLLEEEFSLLKISLPHKSRRKNRQNVTMKEKEQHEIITHIRGKEGKKRNELTVTTLREKSLLHKSPR